MRVKYVGPSPGVEIADSGQWAERGETVDVEDDLAVRLCEQDVWEAVDRPAPVETADEAEEETQP